MKVLIAGGFYFPWYEEACAQALERLRIRVVRFSWSSYFSGLLGKVEQKFLLRGWRTRRFETSLLSSCLAEQPNVVLIWRGIHVRPHLLRQIKKDTNALLVSYNNDNPFATVCKEQWRWFVASIGEYDINFVYRPGDIREYLLRGSRRSEILLPYYIPTLHRPIFLTDSERAAYSCDLVFVGHYEPDGRVDYLKSLVKAGYRLRLFGNNWPHREVETVFGSRVSVQAAVGEDYVRALTGASVCVSFLSKLNRDCYTRRSFEIPACAKVMLSERTRELQSLFKEETEAAYFSNIPEMLSIARRLLDNPMARRDIEVAARTRCITSGYSVDDRMKQWLDMIHHH